MTSRHRRALYWTLGIAAIMAGPIGFRIWIQSDAGAVAVPNLGEVGSFVYHDTAGEPITREVLRRGVAIIVHIPKSCDGGTCELAMEQARTTEKWIQEQLSAGYTEEKNPLFLITSGEGFQPSLGKWHVIKEEVTEGSLLPSGYPNDKAWLVVVDPWLVFAGAWDLTKPVDHKRLERVLSRTTFEQYIGNYLARRTFMGPKRDPR